MISLKEDRMYRLILSPVVSEKATMLADKRQQIMFQVLPDATKSELKIAVEKIFSVSVKSVQVLNRQGKKKRFGKYSGRRDHARYAFVSLMPGQEINFMTGGN